MYVSVKDGTHAGWRKPQQAKTDWKCPACGAFNRYYWTHCPNSGCNHPRD